MYTFYEMTATTATTTQLEVGVTSVVPVLLEADLGSNIQTSLPQNLHVRSEITKTTNTTTKNNTLLSLKTHSYCQVLT
jgi:hypothetical protein